MKELLELKLNNASKAEFEPLWNAFNRDPSYGRWSKFAPDMELEKHGFNWYPTKLLSRLKTLNFLQNQNIPPICPRTEKEACEILNRVDDEKYLENLVFNSLKITKQSAPWENAERLLSRILAIEENEQKLNVLSDSFHNNHDVKVVRENNSAIFTHIPFTGVKLYSKKASKEQKSQAECSSGLNNTNPLIAISYNSSDQKLVHKLSIDLQNMGYDVLINKEQTGQTIREAMEKEVRNSNIVLPILSKEYEVSENCQIEFNYAVDSKKQLIPIICQRGYQPGERVASGISNFPCFDFSESGDYLADMKEYVASFEKLVKQINDLL